MKVPFSKVSCNGNEIKYVEEVLNCGWLTTAKKTLTFERIFAEKVHAEYGCAVNSCTAALHLGLEALGVKPGDKVFVPDMTFTATAEVVRYLNADPVFLDVDYDTSLVTPAILREGIAKNPDVKYLIIVHYGGHPAEMLSDGKESIMDICKQYDIKVMEDAAHAFPARIQNQMIGSLADVTCFSFYANKTITTGEGGMLTTNNPEIHNRVKVMRLHGINRDIWDRFTSHKASWEYDVVAPGFKYNMPDINAAIGLAQLERADFFREKRQNIAIRYYKLLGELEMLDLPACNVPMEHHAWHLFPVKLNGKSEITRNVFIQKMAEAGIGTSVHYKPIHCMHYYMNQYDLKSDDFPVSEKIWNRTVSLPIYPSLKKNETELVVGSIIKILSVPTPPYRLSAKKVSHYF